MPQMYGQLKKLVKINLRQLDSLDNELPASVRKKQLRRLAKFIKFFNHLAVKLDETEEWGQWLIKRHFGPIVRVQPKIELPLLNGSEPPVALQWCVTDKALDYLRELCRDYAGNIWLPPFVQLPEAMPFADRSRYKWLEFADTTTDAVNAELETDHAE